MAEPECQTRSFDFEARARENYTTLVPEVMTGHRSQAEEDGFDFVGDDQIRAVRKINPMECCDLGRVVCAAFPTWAE